MILFFLKLFLTKNFFLENHNYDILRNFGFVDPDPTKERKIIGKYNSFFSCSTFKKN